MTDDEELEQVEAALSKIMKEAYPDLMMEGFICVIPCIGEDGQSDFVVWCDHDRPVHSTLGYLRLVEHDLVKANDEEQPED